MARLFAAAVVLVAVLPALASEPGQPLDCSDWVFLEPGLYCVPFIPFGAANTASATTKGSQREIDNDGSVLTLRLDPMTGYDFDWGIRRIEIVRLDSAGERVIAYMEDRQAGPDLRDHVRPVTSYCAGRDDCAQAAGIRLNDTLTFDPVHGRLLVSLHSYCTPNYGCCCGGVPPEYNGWWIAAIGGFTTLYEIQQGYVPVPGGFGFRIPAYPEGMFAVDHLDTYWGTLSTVGDWSQAQPLQCDYPATPPSVGDYLTVNDSLPDPPAGHGRYYVTAATYQGETRAGRRATNGVLRGRDFTRTPACAPPSSEVASAQ